MQIKSEKLTSPAKLIKSEKLASPAKSIKSEKLASATKPFKPEKVKKIPKSQEIKKLKKYAKSLKAKTFVNNETPTFDLRTLINSKKIKSLRKKRNLIKPFCKICKKAFKNYRILDTHYAIHEGPNPNCCKFCEKKFIYPSSLHKHEIQVHKSEKPFSCENCEKSFKRAETLVSKTCSS